MLRWRKPDVEWTVKVTKQAGNTDRYEFEVFNHRGKKVFYDYDWCADEEAVRVQAAQYLSSQKKLHHDYKHPDERVSVFTERDL